MKAVFFYSIVPAKNATKKTDFLEVAGLTFPLNRKYYDSNIVYTTHGTIIDPDPGFDKIIAMPKNYDSKLTHYMRVRSWLLYLDSAHFDQDTVFLDGDVIINKDLKHVFENDFALAFSAYQTGKSYSLINAGVFFAKHARKQEAIEHMKKIVSAAVQDRLKVDPRYRRHFPCAGIWGLDEYCLTKYLSFLCERDLGITLRDFVLSLGLNEFRPLSQGISLFGYNYNMKVKDYDRSLWPKATVMHFNGMSEYDKPAIIRHYLSHKDVEDCMD